MIVGIVGKKRSGKDTIADYLVKKYGFKRKALADPIKKACKHIFLMNDKQLWGEKKEVIDGRFGVSPRRVLQVMGTELFQYAIYDHIPELEKKIPLREFWMYRFKLEYERMRNKNVVVPDIRFPHEAVEIKKMNGIILKVIRPDLVSFDDHPSEMEMENITDIDYTVMNSLSIEDLQTKIDKLIKKWEL